MIAAFFDNLKSRLTARWDFMRFFRMGLGIILLVEAFMNSDMLAGLLGIMLSAQALWNIGCCGVGGCDVNYRATKPTKEDITYEEIK